MGSIYARGESLWLKYRSRSGKVLRKPSGYRKGQEADARAVLVEVERQVAAEVADEAATVRWPTVVAPEPEAAPTTVAASGQLTVREYGEEWIKRRRGQVATVDNEESRLVLHVYPLIGDMAIADVRPRHIRDLVNALKQKKSEAKKSRGTLAPRTVRHIYALLRRFFKSAVIDEHIAASPVLVEKGTLPKNVDKDPAWRSTAIFERNEVVALISDARISHHRRVIYALEGLAGVRHGEAAGLRWCDYDDGCEPLGKLVISRSYEKDGTKTQMTREIPVHPTLATILETWKGSGWKRKYKRQPTAEDLIVPTESFESRRAPDTLKKLKKDLATLKLRARRGHDLRRTFITLAQVDGARRDVLKPLTHPGEVDIVGLYTSFPWPTVCAEVAKLRVFLPGDDEAGGSGTGASDPADESGEETNGLAAAATVPTVPRHTPGHRVECAQEFSSTFEPLPGFEPGTYGLRRAPAYLHRFDSAPLYLTTTTLVT